MRGLKFSNRAISGISGMSHPAWDAWIEIDVVMPICLATAGRIPHGMRGLKFKRFRVD